MSDGICNIASGDFVELKNWRGLDWTLSTKTLRRFAEIERFILGRRGDPLRTVLDWVARLPDEVFSHGKAAAAISNQVEAALRMHLRSRFATQEEINDYNNTPAGMGHRLWLACFEKHPDKTLEECTEHVLRASLDDVARLSHALDGVDQTEQLKNCDGPENGGASQ